MSKEQMSQEIKYKLAVSLLKSLLSKGIITTEEYKEVEEIHRNLYIPLLAEVYM
jgi:hypothetical protein